MSQLLREQFEDRDAFLNAVKGIGFRCQHDFVGSGERLRNLPLIDEEDLTQQMYLGLLKSWNVLERDGEISTATIYLNVKRCLYDYIVDQCVVSIPTYKYREVKGQYGKISLDERMSRRVSEDDSRTNLDFVVRNDTSDVDFRIDLDLFMSQLPEREQKLLTLLVLGIPKQKVASDYIGVAPSRITYLIQRIHKHYSDFISVDDE